jgi:hypothetical protein
MDAFMNTEEIRSVIGAVLSRRFPKLRVSSINHSEVADDNGNDIIDVSVVIEVKNKSDFNPAKIPLCLSEIIDGLSDKDAPFPILSFIAKSELGKTKPEAA